MTDILLPNFVALDEKYRSINIHIPNTTDTEYLFGSEYLPSETELGAKAYWPDVRTKAVVQNWNTSYPGLEWEQPFYAYGMNGPILYEIVQAPAGMSLVGGRMTRNPVTGFFDYQSPVLTWLNPVAGRYRIGLRATDQIGQKVYWIFDHFSSAARNFFMALNATGNGSGSSPSNYASYVSTFVGQTTDSPSKGKVLRIKQDDYPLRTQLRPNKAYTAASWCAMPGDSPTFSQVFTIDGDDLNFHGIEWKDVAISANGVVTNFGGGERIGFFDFKFRGCSNTAVGNSENQSCIGMMSGGKYSGRRGIFVGHGEFINCDDLHGFDYFDVAEHVFVGNKLTINNGTSTLTRSWIFPKADVYRSEIMHNVADIPTVSGGTAGVCQLYNAVNNSTFYETDVKNRFEYNYQRVSGGQNLQLNFSAGTTANPTNYDNFVKRNTLIGGTVPSQHWITDGSPERRSFLEDNVVINPAGGIATPVGSESWLVKTGNIESTNTALVDADGHILAAEDKGKKGHGIWRPE